MSNLLVIFLLLGYIANFMKICNLTSQLSEHGFDIDNAIEISLREFTSYQSSNEMMEVMVKVIAFMFTNYLNIMKIYKINSNSVKFSFL